MSIATPQPSAVASATAEAFSGTRHAPSGLPFIATGAAPESSPTLAAQFNSLMSLLLDRSDHQFRASKSGALAIDVGYGRYRDASDTEVLFEGTNGVALTNAATNYVYLDIATNLVAVSTSGFPATKTDYIPIAQYVCSGGAIVTSDWEADRRNFMRFWVNASSAAPTGTTGNAFTLDSDNAGAGANSQIRANRGSTDAEDAAIEWDEASDRWNFRTQHSTLTYAPINALSLLISGTSMVTADGAAKVQSAVAGNGLGHSSGVLAVNVDASTIEIEIISGTLQIKDAGVTAAKLSNALADTLPVVAVPDSSGAGAAQTITIQIKDKQGNNLAEVVYLQVGVYQDADGAAAATNATLAAPSAGSRIGSWITTDKIGRYKTDANGALTLDVSTIASPETVYVLVAMTTRSRSLDCSDIGTITRRRGSTTTPR